MSNRRKKSIFLTSVLTLLYTKTTRRPPVLNMPILIFFVFVLPFCQGRWDAFHSWNVFGGSTPTVGKNRINLWCYCHMKKDLVNHREIVPVMFAQIRHYKNSTWRNIAMLNKTGHFMLYTNQIAQNYSISDGVCENYTTYYYVCKMHIISSFTTGCSIDPYINAVFRCQFSNGREIFTSHEKEIWDKDVRHFHMFRQGEIKLLTNYTNTLNEDNVVQLQFTGDIQDIFSLSENVRWCKKSSGEFQIMNQPSPVLTLIPSSTGGCTQISKIFYQIAQNETDVEIMCDLKYYGYRNKCKERSDNPKILINTGFATKADIEWRISPIIIYDQDGIINLVNFTIPETGRTVHLLCMAAAFPVTDAVAMNWCFRKKDDANWAKIAAQKEINAIGSSSLETLKVSRITYRITKYDKVVHFLCEISTKSFNTCGSGLNSVNVTIEENGDETPNGTAISENQEKNTCCTVLPLRSTKRKGNPTAVLTTLSVLLCVLLTVAILFMVATYRRGKITLIGFVIKIERQNKDTEGIKKSENKTNISLQKERRKKYDTSETSFGFERQEIYENEDLKNENVGEASTEKTEYELSKYEELRIREKEQEYEEII